MLSDHQKLLKVIQLLEEFCLAGENILFEGYNFHKRRQGEDEPIENFITAVRTLAQTCDFTQDGKNCSAHDQMVRDWPLCGICDHNVRQRLLGKDKLDLETCINECRSTSITRHQVQQTTAISVNRIPSGMGASDNVFTVDATRHCDYCGTAYQRALRFCPACGQECTPRGRKKNHFSTVCKASRFRKIGRHELPSRSPNSRSRVHQLMTGVDLIRLPRQVLVPITIL